MTAKEVTRVLKQLMDFELTPAVVDDLWNRFIYSDKEFRECYYTEKHAIELCEVRAQNLIPLQSTGRSSETSLSILMNLLLMSYFDEVHFLEEDRSLPYPNRLLQDFVNMFESYNDLMIVLQC